jgi:hypothetical protein
MRVILEEDDWRIVRWDNPHGWYNIQHACSDRVSDHWDALCSDEVKEQKCTLNMCMTKIPKKIYLAWKELTM